MPFILAEIGRFGKGEKPPDRKLVRDNKDMIDLTEHLSELPADLREKAFSVGSLPWPAWTVLEALAVIAHLRSHSLAVTWLHSVTKIQMDGQTHYKTKTGSNYRDYNPYIRVEETWEAFVERTCSEARDLLSIFRPPSSIIKPRRSQIGAVVMWEAEESLPELREGSLARELANRPALSLPEEIALFRSWAAPRLAGGEYSCWEVDYPNWSQIKQAFGEFLGEQPFRDWDGRTLSDVLYIVARDNDSPSLAHALAEDVERLLFLAEAVVVSSERDAKYQFADELSRLDRSKHPIEPILLAMLQDEDEYVRRLGLIAIGRVQSPLAEPLALAAWETGEEYQRMVALQILHDLNSRWIGDYFVKAEQDESRYVREYAARLKAERF